MAFLVDFNAASGTPTLPAEAEFNVRSYVPAESCLVDVDDATAATLRSQGRPEVPDSAIGHEDRYDRQRIICAADGAIDAAGTLAAPLDLATALTTCEDNAIITLRGGDYVTDWSTTYEVTASGVIIRNLAGEFARCDLRIKLSGANSRIESPDYRLSIFTGDPARTSTEVGSGPSDISRGGGGRIALSADGCKLVNIINHDGADGIYAFGNINTEVYGVITFNHGWTGPDRRHGHLIYTHNHIARYQKQYRNIIGLNGYALGGLTMWSASINNIHNMLVEDFITFNNYVLLASYNGASDGCVIRRLYTYDATIDCGYTGGARDNYEVTLEDCVIYGDGGDYVYRLNNWRTINMTGCRFVRIALPRIDPRDGAAYNVGGNEYYTDRDIRFNWGDTIVASADWPTISGCDADSSFNTALPTGVWTYLIPNEYAAAFATLMVYNHDGAATVSVDMSAWASDGAAVRVHNPMMMHEEYVDRTVSDGAISVPMQVADWTYVAPIGEDAPLYDNPLPKAFAFVLEKT